MGIIGVIHDLRNCTATGMCSACITSLPCDVHNIAADILEARTSKYEDTFYDGQISKVLDAVAEVALQHRITIDSLLSVLPVIGEWADAGCKPNQLRETLLFSDGLPVTPHSIAVLEPIIRARGEHYADK